MNQIRNISIILLSCILWSCSDKGTSFDDEPPELPQLTKTRPDISYFENENNTPPENSSTQVFHDAKSYMVPVLVANLYIDAFIDFIEAASKTEPVFKNGRWVWTYEFSFEQDQATFRLTAERGEQSTEWKLFGTFETENKSFEDVLLLSGSVRNDGNSGSWQLNFVIETDGSESVIKIIELDWTVSSESENTITLIVFDQGIKDGTFTFNVDGPEHTLIVVGSDDKPHATIYWNTNTSEGHIIQNKQKRCWNSSLMQVQC